MRIFCIVMIEMMKYEQAIGRATGRNPKAMARLSEDITRWEGYLGQLEINRVP